MAGEKQRVSAGPVRHPDGKRRCAWCTLDPLYVAYHDDEWGVAVHDERRLFEMLCLEGAQAGLSWLTVLRKRETYRAAFDGFDAEKIARYGAAKRKRLMGDPGIVRNRLKIDAFIGNAKAYLALRERSGDFAEYLWRFTDGKVIRRRPRSLSAIAQTTPYSDAMSRDLKRLGFRFVGSTICHAFMQAVGIVDEHQHLCWRASPRAAGRAVGRAAAAAALVLAGLFAGAGSVNADTPKPVLKAIDVFDLQWVADPQISPDGKNIAYVRMRMDIKTDAPQGVIWLVDIDGKHARPLSSADDSSHPRWSPDGTRIAYFGGGGGDGPKQLNLYWAQSGVTAPISHFLQAPSSLAWSPDGRWLAFTMQSAAERKPLKVDIPEAPKGAKWADPPKLIDRMVFRIDGEGYLPNSYNQLFVIGADGGAARQLTHGDFDVDGAPAFTADGKGVLFASNRRADADFEPIDSEIYRVDLADDALRALTDRRGPDFGPTVSPDGKHIAYLGFDDKHLGYQATQLYVMDSDGTHSRSLTPSLDRDAASPHWIKNGQELLFEYSDHGSGKIASVDLRGNVRVLAQDMGGADVTRPYTGGSFSAAENGRFAYTQANPAAPPALGAGDASHAQTLAALSDSLLLNRSLGRVEEFDFDSSADGRRVQGWIIKPPGFDSSQKYPLLLEIHGGPFASYGPSFAAELQLYAAAGYVVVYLNPRGSTSYGEVFANLIHHDYPGRDYDDLMSAVDAVLGRGYIDRERLFVTGGSGGGVLTAWIVGHTDRFRAAVVVKPVINWTSFVLTADMTSYFYRYWFDAFPWDDLQSYWKRSPLAFVGNVRTPTMLMTGEVDYRTPSSEAEQFYEALKLRKIDTALVRVPNASHDISARPSLLVDKVAYVLAWFHAHDKPAQ